MSTRTEVARINIDSLSAFEATVTIRRTESYYRPTPVFADDLPDDIRAALLAWLVPTADIDASRAAEVGIELLRKVRDYWEGRPTAHHGDHIYKDVCDVLRAIEPAPEPEAGR